MDVMNMRGQVAQSVRCCTRILKFHRLPRLARLFAMFQPHLDDLRRRACFARPSQPQLTQRTSEKCRGGRVGGDVPEIVLHRLDDAHHHRRAFKKAAQHGFVFREARLDLGARGYLLGESLVQGRQLSGPLMHALLELFPSLTQCLLGFFLIVNIRAGADPLDDPARFVTQRKSTSEMPAVLPVETLEPILDLVIFAAGHAVSPAVQAALDIIGMQHRLPAPVFGLRERHSRVVEPTLVVIIDTAVGLRGPDDLRQRVGEKTVAAFAFSQSKTRALGGTNVAHASDVVGHLPACDLRLGLREDPCSLPVLF